MTDPRARAWKEIDLDTLAHNARVLQDLLHPGCRLMAVVKADAYGHGAVPAARRLAREGVTAFAVACLDEGITLRRAGVQGMILILGYTPPEAVPLLVRWGVTQTVADEAHGRALNAAGRRLSVHLALDTGMRRLGVSAEDLRALHRLYGMENLNITGVFSHLCVSDSPNPSDRDYTQGQLERFYRAVDRLRRGGHDPGEIHIRASGGILNLPPQPCSYARAGIALYGAGGGSDLRPVLSLRARIACIRTLAPGERAGYGLDFQAVRETRLAVVTVGYGDGLPRALCRLGGRALVNGRSCPMAGRMCMDQLLLDVTDVPRALPGQAVTLIGQEAGQRIQVEEIAQACGTIPNEVLCQLGGRLGLVLRQ